ncbi:MAG TPA: IS5 family transposase [Chloroflexota bacterium]|nr:IS5 family transposase [Chloroflexota bacterium]
MDPLGDALWEAIQPLLPPEPSHPHGGPPRISHRAALGGILFVLRHGLRWRDLPLELGYGSGVTCWRRLRQWQALGIWEAVHQVALNWLGDLDAIDWSRASVDSLSVRAKRGGERTGPNPTDRGKAGSKYHLLVDRQGVPLAVQLTAANVHDSKVLEPLVDAVRPIRRPTGQPGRPRKRPAKLHADKGYDYPEKRRALRRRGITPRIARRGVESSDRLGRFRWVVERSLAWLVAFRKLAIRFDRQAASVLAFLHLACALICLRYLAHAETEAH